MSYARLSSYITAAGLLGLAVYNASIGDFEGAITALFAGLGIGHAANSGPRS
jgi:hypothetical protein